MKDKIEFIAFDADDTLWESELYIQEFEHKFCNLLRQYLPASSISQRFFETEYASYRRSNRMGTRASAETGYTTGRREGDHIVTSWEI